MKLNALKWLAENNGTVIKRTLIGAGTIIGLALLSGLTEDNGTEEFDEFDGNESNGVTAEPDAEIEVETPTEE